MLQKSERKQFPLIYSPKINLGYVSNILLPLTFYLSKLPFSPEICNGYSVPIHTSPSSFRIAYGLHLSSLYLSLSFSPYTSLHLPLTGIQHFRSAHDGGAPSSKLQLYSFIWAESRIYMPNPGYRCCCLLREASICRERVWDLERERARQVWFSQHKYSYPQYTPWASPLQRDSNHLEKEEDILRINVWWLES